MSISFRCRFLVSCLAWLFLQVNALATHIRAGEITAVRVSQFALEYKFTVTGFRDSGSNIPFGGGVLKLGDGTEVSAPFIVTAVPVGNELELVTFSYTHTYTAPNGNGYLVSYEEDFRNAGIINMDNSVGTKFYVESLIVIDPFYGLNNTPILTVPPIDFGAVGGTFIHNPGAYDPDGDSLSYRLTTPKQGRDNVVNNYRPLNDPEFYTNYAEGSQEGNPPNLSIDPVSGDLIWDAPGDVTNQEDAFCPDGKAEYNVAFIIEEWRLVAGEWRRLGYVTRDMQIIVCAVDNEQPVITPPDDICVTAGDTINELVFATDPDGQPVQLEAFGGPFEVPNSASFSPDPPEFQGQSPAVLEFEWNTNCSNVRERPYEVQFKATDNPEFGPSRVEFETFQVTVAGPAPTGLEAEAVPGRSIELNWDNYACSEAQSMQIWRKTGSFDVELDDCDVGMPANTGYRMIDEIDISERSYRDNNNGKGLAAGSKYCYRLVAEYPLPEGGLSYVSTEVCDSMLIDVPVITHVDVLSTSETNGRILVRWIPPYQIDTLLFPPDYTYDIFRKSNESGSQFLKLNASPQEDTMFIDTGLNTRTFQYTYFILGYAEDGTVLDSSATASSIRLELRPLVQSMELTWTGDVPWSLRTSKYPYHYIYRDRIASSKADSLVLIDSVDVTRMPLSYLDAGSHNDETLHDSLEYCYYVSTNGTYDNTLIPEPLVNRTQIACAQPNDTIPPCRPPNLTIDDEFQCETFLADKPCDYNVFQNKVVWEVDADPNCGDDIIGYNIYFSQSGEEGSYELIDNAVSTAFTHYNLRSFKGCYKVASVDRSGNESDLTEEVCNDNCPYIRFPNVFSPNNDGVNDVFTPIYSGTEISVPGFDFANCPRFVLEMEFRVFDRSGNRVFEYTTEPNENDYLIRWDGTNQQGLELESGTYYYEAVVTFDVFDPKEATKKFNGWLKLLR